MCQWPGLGASLPDVATLCCLGYSSKKPGLLEFCPSVSPAFQEDVQAMDIRYSAGVGEVSRI